MEYDDKIKSCTLSHCIACGSTRIWTEKSTTWNPLSLFIIAAFFVMVFYSIVFDKFTQVSPFFIFFGMLIMWVLMEAYKSNTVNLCLDCSAKGFTPMTKVKLQDKKKEIIRNFSKIDPKEIEKLMGTRPKSKFPRRNLAIYIISAGLGLAVIQMLFGDTIQENVASYFNQK